ncbi:MAG: transglycosylase SLT domain-containing protein [Ignavibacteria bacterium]|nr:transglycosylase SLT domain-containing protein [Ignavibacteria bacterium]
MSTDMTSLDTSVARSAVANSRISELSRVKMNETNPSHLSEAEKTQYAKAARGFESMFVSMMMKQMKESMLDDDHKDDGENMSFGADTLGSYADMQFSDFVARSGKGMGLADMIYKKMTGGESLPTISIQLPTDVRPRVKDSAPESLATPLSNLKTGDTFSARVEDRLLEYEPIITQASKQFNVPTHIIKAVITAESAGKSAAVSKVGAKGLMQLMDGTADDLGVKNSFDPGENITGGTKYLRQMLDQFGGNVDLALAAYNAGPGNVKKHGGIPPFQETQAYVRKVKQYAERYE